MPIPAEELLDDEGLFARDIDGRLVRMDRATAEDLDRDVTLTIDGQKITVKKAVPATDAQGNPLRDEKDRVVPRPTTIYDAAATLFLRAPGDVNPIPTLCHLPHMDPVAVCRVCVVEIAKEKRGKVTRERKLLPSCQHRVEETMVVQTIDSPDPEARERIRGPVRMLTELLMTGHPTPCAKEKQSGDCELEALARRLGIAANRFTPSPPRGRDNSSLVIAVDHSACILCDRCIRGCNTIRHNEVIGRMGKGYRTRIAFDLDAPMGHSTCVACGECSVSCPTGALTTREIVAADPWKKVTPRPEPVAARELYEHPQGEIRRAFAEMSHEFLRWNAKAVARRRFKKGEVICREGEFGSTAFFIEQGKVDIYITAQRKHVVEQASRGGFGSVLRFASRLVSRGEAPRAEEGTRQFIPIDASVSLPYDRPQATLGAGELFGEMTCMSFYPRSATVRAAEDCTVLEMLRNVLYIMQRSRSYRAILEKKYRDHAISNHLQGVKLFAALQADPAQFARFVAEMRPKVQLVRIDPGQVIFQEGAPADDGFYLVRTGFVKVSQRGPGGEHVLSYIGPGGYFGEIGLLWDVPEIRALAPPGVRTASCSALDHVELVRITSEDFRDILGRFPDAVRGPLVAEALRRLEQNRNILGAAERMPLGEFLEQGLMNAQSLLVLDLEKCTRCDECTKACSDSHDNVTRLIRDGLRFDKFLVASSCRSCLDPYCMVGCPVGSIRRRESREIIIEDWCIGCGKCAENCPYGNINMHSFPTGEMAPDPEDRDRRIPVVQQKATTCDLCHSLGDREQPSCVYACPHDAAHRMSGDELRQLIERGLKR